MPTFDEIVRVYRVERLQLQTWIDQHWVRPTATPKGYVFDEVDEARITLIQEMRQEFMVNDEGLELVLSLLDQLYATRRVLQRIEQAMESLPEPVQREIRAVLRHQDVAD